jgi:HEPN domain-containing protein
MWRVLTNAAALLGLAAAVAAQEPAETNTPPGKPDSPAKQYEAIEQEFATAQQDFSKSYREAKTDEERQKVIAEKYPPPQQFVGRMFELAEKYADDPVAVDALVWIVTRVRAGDEADKALAILGEKHTESEKIGPVCQSLVYSSSPAAEKLLRAVLEKNPHHEAQGQACYALAKLLGQQSELASQFESNPDELQNVEQQYGKEYVERLREAGPEKLAAEAEQLLAHVVETCQDIQSYRGSLADTAKADLFEIRNLAIGKVAPEIEGEDMDGQRFKLSDYRGKVVVLDFWGNW